MNSARMTAALAATALALAAGNACAQAWPAKSIRLVVGQTPGGGNDAMARMIAAKISGPLGQQVVVDNRPGAGGLIAADMIAKAAPDGYNLFLGNVAALAIIPNVQKNVPYNPLKDFDPISLMATAPLLVVVHPSLPINSIKQLIALAKAKPGQINYASNGVGSSTHLATELFTYMTGTSMQHIPYKGLGPASADLLSGQVQVMFSSAVAMMPLVKAGRLKAFAMTGAKRSPAMPDVPTVAEAGVKDYEAGSWYGVLAPAGTDKAIVERLYREISTAMKTKDVLDRLEVEGVVAIGSTPAEFAAHIKKEHSRIGDMIRKSGAKFE